MDCVMAVDISASVAFQSSERIGVSGVAGFHVFEGGEYEPLPFLGI